MSVKGVVVLKGDSKVTGTVKFEQKVRQYSSSYLSALIENKIQFKCFYIKFYIN